MRKMFYSVSVFLLLSPGAVLGAEILAVFSVASVSHQIVYSALTLELNKRGHNLTVITPNPVRDPRLKNYREIDTSFIYDTWNREMIAEPRHLRMTMTLPEVLAVKVSLIAPEICHYYFLHPEVQKLIEGNPKFDLLIVEFGVNPCFYGFSKFSDYKYLGIFSMQTNPVVHADMGNPATPSYIPEINLPYLNKITFFQRLRIFMYQSFLWCVYAYVIRTQEPIARQYLGKDLASLVDIERNLSVHFVNSHFTMSVARPNIPNMIEIGGPPFHLRGRKPKALPKDIQEFVDSAEHGVIYFSLGSNVKTSNISSREEKLILESFGKIKQKVLWKWENENVVVDPKNVKVGKWFPQADILAHPKVKGFVTQGGLQSIGEAVEYKVPMILMPFFADQSHNSKKMESVGVGICMDFDALNAEDFTRALKDIVRNPKYKENMIKFNKMVRDQSIPPLEKAVWWTEYVIRHKGAPHLRSPAAAMPWHQYFMLDVLAFLFLLSFALLYVIYAIVKTAVRLVFRLKKQKGSAKTE